MMNVFIIMEFSLKVESLTGLKSVGRFYILIYISDVVGTVLSLFIPQDFSRSFLDKLHTSLMFFLSLILLLASLFEVLSSPVEILLLSKPN